MSSKSQIVLRLLAKEMREFKTRFLQTSGHVAELRKFASQFWKEDLQRITEDKRFKKVVKDDLTDLKRMVSELTESVRERNGIYDEQISGLQQRVQSIEQSRRASGT